MVVIKDPSNYQFLRFEVSKSPNKKYDALLLNKLTQNIKRVGFGDKNYEQYKDSTGLGIYSHKNHLDKVRRENYRKRHNGEQNKKFSSGWFSYYYLW